VAFRVKSRPEAAFEFAGPVCAESSSDPLINPARDRLRAEALHDRGRAVALVPRVSSSFLRVIFTIDLLHNKLIFCAPSKGKSLLEFVSELNDAAGAADPSIV